MPVSRLPRSTVWILDLLEVYDRAHLGVILFAASLQKISHQRETADLPAMNYHGSGFIGRSLHIASPGNLCSGTVLHFICLAATRSPVVQSMAALRWRRCSLLNDRQSDQRPGGQEADAVPTGEALEDRKAGVNHLVITSAMS